jgi:hypothetical protein
MLLAAHFHVKTKWAQISKVVKSMKKVMEVW